MRNYVEFLQIGSHISSSEDSETELDIDKWDSWFGDNDQQLKLSFLSDSHSESSD